jgi:hypothetical protein
MNQRKTFDKLLTLIIITLIVVCGCSRSDEPLNPTFVITSQTRNLTILELTNNNWYDWTNVKIEAFSSQVAVSDYYNMQFNCRAPKLMESGKTYTVEINTSKRYPSAVYTRWDGILRFVTIKVSTVKGDKICHINLLSDKR